jgi:hypothetical protein
MRDYSEEILEHANGCLLIGKICALNLQIKAASKLFTENYKNEIN